MVDVRVLWEPRDLWVGVYWTRVHAQTDDGPKMLATTVYVCLVPCLPIRITKRHRVAILFGATEAPRHE